MSLVDGPRCLVLDGFNLIHRARGGFQKGDWAMVFNFFRGLKPLVEKYKPSEVYFVLEGIPKRNLQLLPEYKGNRAEIPADFERQFNTIMDVLHRFPITIVQHPDFEADDTVLNVVLEKTNSGIHSYVVSSDSDFTQLLQLDLDVTVYNWREKHNLSIPEFDYVKWKALRGDPTDNIPKCPKMSDKTALEVLKDPLRFKALMDDAGFKSIYERNLELVSLRMFDVQELKKMTIEKCASDWMYVRDKFQSFDFKSMTNDASWGRYTQAFESCDA